MNVAVITDTLASMIRIATPLMLMALGGLLCDRAGVFNIAMEGFALVGAFAAVAAVQFSGGSVWMGLLAAILVGALYSALFGLFVTKFKADNIIASIAMNTLGAGLTSYLLRAIFGVQGAFAPDKINKLPMIQIPIIKDIPILKCISGQSIVTYFTVLLIIAIFIMLFRTKTGLAVCAVGESDVAARTAGIKPELVKWKVILISGALSGLAGAYLSTISVSQFSENMIQGRGFTAFTAYVFGGSHPIFASLVSLLFGLAEAIGIRIELMGMDISPSIISMFPYMLAIAALAVSSYMMKRKLKGTVKMKKKKEKLA
ncbi:MULTISPECIES: ABC transporter permease [Lachnospiraceae]|jgi:ABC-type uncharacterized transport system permease subunit|uniref:ABC transporter permease n=1 Tax=Faecalicatena acetigenes TaxID=2981790 RepID=A0ABT2T741_9FIRM|nr:MULTISPECIES: ABC transporter permease [Lachnospiraceae]MCU6746073.1 ABC transporter permease [Faecalicatena acetigenes]RGT72973.1 ABC transporter permease [Ruminococcus sp. AF18-22]SCG93401.1 L-arabinose transporter permease protein [uncultured Clostridium sp.]